MRRASAAITCVAFTAGHFDDHGESGDPLDHGCHRGEPALADDEVTLLTL